MIDVDTSMPYDDYENHVLNQVKKIFAKWHSLTDTDQSFHILKNSELFQEVEQARYFLFISDLDELYSEYE